MKTEDLISQLAADLKNPGESKNWAHRYWQRWAVCAFVLSGITWLASIVAPNEVRLPVDLFRTAFWVEVGAWGTLAISAAGITFLASIPGRSCIFLKKMAYVSMLVLLISLVFRFNLSGFSNDILVEKNLGRGPCGFFIGLAGVASAVTMFGAIRRAAPTQLSSTAIWTTVGTGACPALLMHLVCTHESSVHVILWHVLPLTLAIYAVSFFSKKFLRW